MIGDELPASDHVVRYVRGRDVSDEGMVNGAAFQLRPNEDGLSVNWLEYFAGYGKEEQLEKVRSLSRLQRSRSARYAELNVGATKRYISQVPESVRFVRKPLEAEGDFLEDPSHCEMVGLLPGESAEGSKIGDLIAESILELHPAIP